MKDNIFLNIILNEKNILDSNLERSDRREIRELERQGLIYPQRKHNSKFIFWILTKKGKQVSKTNKKRLKYKIGERNWHK